MKIISPFKDYYDCGMGLGHDDDVVYLRTPREVERYRIYRSLGDRFSRFTVGFCGQVYRGIVFDPSVAGEKKAWHCYSIKDVDKYADACLTPAERDRYYDDSDRRHKHYGIGPRGRYARAFEPRAVDEVAVDGWMVRRDSLFARFNTPIWVESEGGLTINSPLRPLEFFKICPPYQAWQELTMYVGGVLQQDAKPIPEISDEVMAEAKGFDKWSFRKEPSGKRRRK